MTAEQVAEIVNAAQILSVNLSQFRCERFTYLPEDYSISLRIDTDKVKTEDKLEALVALVLRIAGKEK